MLQNYVILFFFGKSTQNFLLAKIIWKNDLDKKPKKKNQKNSMALIYLTYKYKEKMFLYDLCTFDKACR